MLVNSGFSAFRLEGRSALMVVRDFHSVVACAPWAALIYVAWPALTCIRIAVWIMVTLLDRLSVFGSKNVRGDHGGDSACLSSRFTILSY